MTTETVEKKRSVSELNDKQLVKLYIQLRDRRAERKRGYEMEDEGDKGKQEKIEGILLKRFQDNGLESIKTEFGTAYKSTRTSVSVADGEMFFDFVLKTGLFDLMEKRAAKSTIEQYKEEHQELPPGINYSESITLNVRRG